jgi:hypothetical protein
VVLARLGRQLLGREVLGVHADDEHLLVVRAVEDADLAARRQALLIAAQVVLIELARGRDLEALDPDALRIDAAHHVADGAVLPRGIERLEHHDDAVRGLGGQPLLVLRQQRDAVLQQPEAVLLLLDTGLEGGIEILGQPHVRARAHAEGLDEPCDPLRDVVGHLDGPPWSQSSERPSSRLRAPRGIRPATLTRRDAYGLWGGSEPCCSQPGRSSGRFLASLPSSNPVDWPTSIM